MYVAGSLSKSALASALAGSSKFGSESIDMTLRMACSTPRMGRQFSLKRRRRRRRRRGREGERRWRGEGGERGGWVWMGMDDGSEIVCVDPYPLRWSVFRDMSSPYFPGTCTNTHPRHTHKQR